MKNVADLDRELARWDTDLNQAFNNMLELKKASGYRLLFESEPPILLEGISKTRVEPIVRDYKNIWPHLSLIQNAVGQARKLRQKEKRPSQATIDAAFALLEGPSIDLPATATPLRQRGLLTSTPSSNKVTPADMMAAMAKTFEAANQLTFEIGTIWDNLDNGLNELKKEAEGLRAAAKALGAVIVELTQFDQRLDACSVAGSRDPLGAGKQIDGQLRPLLEAVKKALVPLQEQHDQLLKQRDIFLKTLAAAKATLPDLEKLHTETQAIVTNALDAIDKPTTFPRSTFSIERLKTWLEKIATEAVNDPVSAFPKFNNWKRNADEFKSLEEAAKKGYGDLLEQREELKVRLRMYKQTAGRQNFAGRCMVEDPELLKLKTAAEQALARPSDLAVARQAVNEYHDRLRSMERWNQQDGVATPSQTHN